MVSDELIANARRNMLETLRCLSCPDRQRLYADAVPFVHVPIELACQWDQHSTADAVLAYLLGMACEAQNMANISYGRRALATMSRDWIAPRIHDVAERELNLADDWPCRRLLELYSEIDPSLLQRFAKACCDSTDAEIAEAGRDFLPTQP